MSADSVRHGTLPPGFATGDVLALQPGRRAAVYHSLFHLVFFALELCQTTHDPPTTRLFAHLRRLLDLSIPAIVALSHIDQCGGLMSDRQS